MTVPSEWMPDAVMERIHVHWTGARHRANAIDKRSYHVLIEGDGTLVRGNKSIKANERHSGLTPASHTLNANTGAIGVSMCCMFNAKRVPFNAGSDPMTRTQWDVMIAVVADLSQRYNIPVGPRTILTHAEVDPTLGITQRGKWDIVRLAFDPGISGHQAVGDRMRNEVATLLGGRAGPVVPGPSFRVAGVHPDTLNLRDAPNGGIIGQLSEGTIVDKLAESGSWWQVRVSADTVGWVASRFLAPS